MGTNLSILALASSIGIGIILIVAVLLAAAAVLAIRSRRAGADLAGDDDLDGSPSGPFGFSHPFDDTYLPEELEGVGRHRIDDVVTGYGEVEGEEFDQHVHLTSYKEDMHHDSPRPIRPDPGTDQPS